MELKDIKHVLLVDDHPMIVDGYTLALKSYLGKQSNVSINGETSFVGAKSRIDHLLRQNESYDLAIVDFSLPIQTELHWQTGGDIISYLQLVMPSCKTIIVTGHTEIITIYNIVKNIRPNGLINKFELRPNNLIAMINEVISRERFHSTEVKRCIQQIEDSNVLYDEYNREILILLAKGYKLVNLEHHLPLSLPTIKKRIAKMKDVFKVEDTAGLVQYAIKQGFV